MGSPWRVEQISIATVVKEGEAIKLAPKTLDAIETMTRLQGDQHPDDLLLFSSAKNQELPSEAFGTIHRLLGAQGQLFKAVEAWFLELNGRVHDLPE
ncbi:hypothetical protein CF326_g4850 [Tilletia indica]|nr:hypothetical protein CF326_g4850 [Tilletia indica]